jgi:hypothetical protein
MYPWRHNWRNVPAFHYLLVCAIVTYYVEYHVIQSLPRHHLARHEILEGEHGLNAVCALLSLILDICTVFLQVEHMHLHHKQNIQDKLYFEKYDPLRTVRKELIENKL